MWEEEGVSEQLGGSIFGRQTDTCPCAGLIANSVMNYAIELSLPLCPTQICRPSVALMIDFWCLTFRRSGASALGET